MQSPTIFYLHGGPGLSTVFERQRYPDATEVHWWQQPAAVSCAQRPYADLLAATLAEFTRCAEAAGAPLTVMASSFGAHLAVHLARKAPLSIARIVLLAPTYDPEQASLRLARRALAQYAAHVDVGKLAAALAAYEDAPGRARFWDVMGAMFTLPDVPSLYFGPHAGEMPRIFAELLHQPGAFDGPTSVATSDDFAALDHPPSPTPFAGPVAVLFGQHDPMINADQDATVWRTIFPQATIASVDSGHFPLLELSLEACLG